VFQDRRFDAQVTFSTYILMGNMFDYCWFLSLEETHLTCTTPVSLSLSPGYFSSMSKTFQQKMTSDCHSHLALASLIIKMNADQG
jgi:hypothetical protein